ncbi:hypothetical protein WN51_07460 [Melipona quadrifasciata]|uniref:Uncharacterized protein n=1 Tax=Melipona quadrifasciata TaxID=166423 RepID=A0A0M9A9H2_9HYME|nr:hypothetical protein WN51_07460 [Melipona quadrifasciata]
MAPSNYRFFLFCWIRGQSYAGNRESDSQQLRLRYNKMNLLRLYFGKPFTELIHPFFIISHDQIENVSELPMGLVAVCDEGKIAVKSLQVSSDSSLHVNQRMGRKFIKIQRKGQAFRAARIQSASVSMRKEPCLSSDQCQLHVLEYWPHGSTEAAIARRFLLGFLGLLVCALLAIFSFLISLVETTTSHLLSCLTAVKSLKELLEELKSVSHPLMHLRVGKTMVCDVFSFNLSEVTLYKKSEIEV